MPYQHGQYLTPDPQIDYGQSTKPWYVSGKLGAGFLQDAEATARVDAVTVDTATYAFRPSFFVGLSAGYRVHPNIRLEGEAAYADYKAEEVTAVRRVNGTVTGTQDLPTTEVGFEAYMLMANMLLDYPIPDSPRWVPYAGLGVGGMFQRNGEKDKKLAYQGLLGVNYGFNENNILVGLGYRYIQSPEFFDDDGIDFDAEMHVIELSLRKHF